MDNTKKLVIIVIIFILILGGILGFALFTGDEGSNNLFSQTSTTTTTGGGRSPNVDVEYTSAELDGEYSNYTAKVDLDNMKVDGNGVTISGTEIKVTSAGTYYFSGESEDANIIVEADKNAEVVLVFDNCKITSTKTAVINGVKAKTIVVNLAKDSENVFTDSSTYTKFTEDDEPDATIFSKTDLVINGSGELTINSNYKDAIASKDTLKIVNTNLEITAKDDGIRGKDLVAIKNSNINIKASGDGIKSTNAENELGNIVIDGGEITITSGDDGIHAANNVVINDGKIEITKSYEGIEGSYIEINGGEISVIATDDGINIAGGNDGSAFGRPGENPFTTTSSDERGRELVINGGKIIVKANGDGLDSNGSITITGGEITVAGATNGGNGALDYDSTCNVTGGSLIVYGATGMWQNPSNTSTQYSIAFSVTGNLGDKIELKDSNNKTIASTTTTMAYGMVCISNSSLQKGETYTLYVNGTSKGSQEITSIVTSNGTGNQQPGEMNTNGGRNFSGGRGM